LVGGDCGEEEEDDREGGEGEGVWSPGFEYVFGGGGESLGLKAFALSIGSSMRRGRVEMISPMTKPDPKRGEMSIAFFPMKPRPERSPKDLSRTAPVSTYHLACPPIDEVEGREEDEGEMGEVDDGRSL